MDSNLVDIVRSIIAEINTTLSVLSIDANKIFLCNTLHLTIDDFVEDEFGNQYRITEFKINEYIIVEPINHTEDFSGSIVIAPDITYLHGDPKSTNEEYGQRDQLTRNKTPFIWLVESYNYNKPKSDSSIDGSFNARLFFMDWANTEKWENDDHNNYVIKPMENLVRAFLSVIENDFNFKTLEDVNSFIRVRFGDKESRPDALVIDEDLSGVDLSFKIEVYDLATCCAPAPIENVCPVAIQHTDDSDGNRLYTDYISSGGNNTRVIQDATNTFNGNSISGVLAEGSKSIIVQDDLGDPKGTITTDTKDELIIEVAAGVTPTGIGYNRPPNNQTTIYALYDEAWQKINNIDPYEPPVNAAMARLDTSNEDFLTTLNAFGNYQRYTGYAGGYYDHSDSTYRDVNGNLSNEDAEFKEVGFGYYIIDHYTGLGWRKQRGGAYNWLTGLSTVYGITLDGHNDWVVPSWNVFQSIIQNTPSGGLTRPPFDIQLSQMTSTASPTSPTTRYVQLALGGHDVVSQAYSSASAVAFVRPHYT